MLSKAKKPRSMKSLMETCMISKPVAYPLLIITIPPSSQFSQEQLLILFLLPTWSSSSTYWMWQSAELCRTLDLWKAQVHFLRSVNNSVFRMTAAFGSGYHEWNFQSDHRSNARTKAKQLESKDIQATIVSCTKH